MHCVAQPDPRLPTAVPVAADPLAGHMSSVDFTNPVASVDVRKAISADVGIHEEVAKLTAEQLSKGMEKVATTMTLLP